MRLPLWLRSLGILTLGYVGGVASVHVAQATPGAQSPYLPFDQLANVLVLVETQYVEPARRELMVQGAIKGLVAELDPHSAFMPAEDYALFQSDTEGEFGGVGVEVDSRDGVITVIAPIEGSPADRAGVRAGDQIVAVDGRPTRGIQMDKLIRTMRGKPGSSVRITLARKGQDKPIDVTLVREIIQVKSVVFRRIDGDVAYVRIKQFQSGTHQEMLEAFGAMRSQASAPLAGVVVDLRNNPGGLVDEAEAIADEFVTSGTLYSTRHRGRVIDVANAHSGGAAATLPVVVLVNEYSASSSELVAGALQDAGRATLVGARTFGKGSVQTIFDLPNGDGLRLTTMRYYTPAGRSIQAEGILPDVVILRAGDKGEPSAFRESDLDGHLPGEGAAQATARVVVQAPADAPAAEELQLARTQADVPTDPMAAKDFDLRVAYEHLRKVRAGSR